MEQAKRIQRPGTRSQHPERRRFYSVDFKPQIVRKYLEENKIERFWKTICIEFLSRTQFQSFEEAVERVRQWMKYYNHKRPHQGIGGLRPADRYFEIQNELRKTIEQGNLMGIIEKT
ncbi:MAG: transposase [Nitrospirae bacterium]|nr:transposase [Nitrospirota bacterium]